MGKVIVNVVDFGKSIEILTVREDQQLLLFDDNLPLSKVKRPVDYAKDEGEFIIYMIEQKWGVIDKKANDVLPCVFERELKYGNVRNNSLKEIMESKAANECWHLDFSKINTCKDCEFRFACKDCRPLGRSKSGDLCDKVPTCRYNPYLGVWENE